MPGALFHSKLFATRSYVGNDGESHFELVPIDGDLDVISLRTWTDLKIFLQKQMSEVLQFPEYAENVDLDLREIVESNEILRHSLVPQPIFEVVAAERLRRYLANGELVFFVIS